MLVDRCVPVSVSTIAVVFISTMNNHNLDDVKYVLPTPKHISRHQNLRKTLWAKYNESIKRLLIVRPNINKLFAYRLYYLELSVVLMIQSYQTLDYEAYTYTVCITEHRVI